MSGPVTSVAPGIAGVGAALPVVAGGGGGGGGGASSVVVALTVLFWEKGLRGKSIIVGWTKISPYIQTLRLD